MVNEMVDLRLKLTCLVNLARPISLINEEIKDLVSFSVSICSILFIAQDLHYFLFRHLKYNAERSCVFIFDKKKPRGTGKER